MKEEILVNYRDIRYILKCDIVEAKSTILRCLCWSERKDIESYEDITVKHLVSSKRIDIKIKSFDEKIDGINLVHYTIQQIRNIGLSATMKYEALTDTNNILRGGAFW